MRRLFVSDKIQTMIKVLVYHKSQTLPLVRQIGEALKDLKDEFNIVLQERDVNNSNVVPAKAGIQIKPIVFLPGFPGQARE